MERQHITRRSAFTVDLTVRRSGKTFWLEVKYTDDVTLSAGVKQARKGLKKYREALQETAAWRLVDNLGGWPMLAEQRCSAKTLSASAYSAPNFLAHSLDTLYCEPFCLYSESSCQLLRRSRLTASSLVIESNRHSAA